MFEEEHLVTHIVIWFAFLIIEKKVFQSDLVVSAPNKCKSINPFSQFCHTLALK